MPRKMSMKGRPAHNAMDKGSKWYVSGTKKGPSTPQNAKRTPPAKTKTGW